jgi:lysyl-tRNA synthetase class 2
MAELSELKAERIKKLNNLKTLGISPYPAKIELLGERISSVQARNILGNSEKKSMFDFLAKKQTLTDKIIAGRILSIRGQGKILFIDVHDQEGKFQVVLKKDVAGDSKVQTFFDNLDIGDFVAFVGKLFITQKGEKSLEATDWQILSKSLLPMPSTFYGLENEEEQMRKRYLDFALNKEKRDLFFKKALFWQTIRSYLISKNFLEVETPYIEVTTGGAEARPFATHHNDYDIDVYLRISVGELWQKRLLAGGFERTFEIGRVFRNEGSSPEHLQEYTNCEFYAAYMDEKEGIELVREMYLEIAKKVFGKTEFTVRGHTFDLMNEWKKLDYRETVLEMTGVDINTASNDDIKKRLQELNVKWEGDNKERLVDTLWKYCRKKISGPAYLTNFPKLMSPLAKLNPDGETAKMFVILLGGSEVGKAYAELNDPQVQKNNFETQQQLIESGDEEAMMSDLDFVEMLEHGMPPAFGFGAGERLFAFLAEQPIRETQLFPLVKPKTENK